MPVKFTTINARFAGKCRRCGESFGAGSRIRYGGRGLTYHLAADCPASQSAAPDMAVAAPPVPAVAPVPLTISYGSTVIHRTAPAQAIGSQSDDF